MTKNFRVYVDRGGKLPQLRHKPWQCVTHPYYVRYENDRPVAFHGPTNVLAEDVSGTRVYCYLTDTWLTFDKLTAE
jgi:hypothetical protein